MSTKHQLLLILAVVFFTGVHCRGHRPCIGPPGPFPLPVCPSPCNCEAENCKGGLVTGVCGCTCSVCAKQEGKHVE